MTMMIRKTFVLAIAVNVICSLCNGTKPFRLKMLSLLPFTGSEPITFKTCAVMQQAIVDMVNKRSDILPDYHVELDFQDEGPASIKAPKAAIDFLRRNMDNQLDQSTFVSPVTIGTFYTTGCIGWARLAGQVDMVLIAFSCTAPSQTARRNIFPNLYRVRSPFQMAILARVNFIKTITKWRKFGIVLNMDGNTFAIESAFLFYDMSSKAGLSVHALEALTDVDDSALVTMKKADIRIISFETGSFPSVPLFLCRAWNLGLRGTRYIFIVAQNFYSQPPGYADSFFPSWCSREKYYEQLKRTMFFGAPYDVVVQHNRKSVLGHSLADYEDMWMNLTNGSATPEYGMRHLCYDVPLHGLMVLDETEKKLQKQNMSLYQYRDFPKQIMLVANQSAAQVRYQNLRQGNFKYSERLEFDGEPQQATQWLPGQGLVVRYSILLRDNATNLMDTASFDVKSIYPLEISEIPKDAPFEVTVDGGEPLYAFVLIILAAAFLVFTSWTCLIKTLHRNDRSLIFKSSTFATCALTTFNVGAILVITPSQFRNSAICQASMFLVFNGMAFYGSSLLFALRSLSKALQIKARTVPIKEACYSFIPTGFSLIASIAWIFFDPLAASMNESTEAKVYYVDSDTVITTTFKRCFSLYHETFVAALIIYDLLLLLGGARYALQVRSLQSFATSPEAKCLTLTFIVTITLYIGSVAVALIAVSSVMFELTICVGLLLQSTASLVIANIKFANKVQPKVLGSKVYQAK